MSWTGNIRRAVDRDLPALLLLYEELAHVYDQTPPVPTAQTAARWRQVTDTGQYILVAAEADALVGTATVIIIPNLGHHGQPWAAVDNVVVRADRRRRGIGAALLAEAGRLAQEHDCYKIVLSSNVARQEAHEFYRSLGWRQTHVGFSLNL